MESLQVTTPTTGQTVLEDETIQELAERLRSPLLGLGDNSYDAA